MSASDTSASAGTERAVSESSAVLRWRPFALAVLLAGAVWFAFLPSWKADWVNWDDPQNFLVNYGWRGFSAENVRWMTTSFHLGHWHPLTWFTFALDWTRGSLDEHGVPIARTYHQTSIVLHALAAVLLFVFARRVFTRAAPAASALWIDIAAFFGALLFAAHPLRAESVAWITERRDVLSGALFFGALVAWTSRAAAETRGERGRGSYVLALVLHALALLAKTSTVILPVVLVVVDTWPLGRTARLGWRRVLVEKVPFVALSIAMGLVAIRGQGQVNDVMVAWDVHPLGARLVQEGFTAFFFAYKSFAPSNLLPLYPLPPAQAFATAHLVVPALVALAVTLAAFALARRWPAFSAAWITFLVGLVLTGGIFQAGPQIVADRYSYLACWPLALLVAGVVLLSPLARRAPREIGLGLLTAASIALVVLTSLQSARWRDSRSLWEYTWERSPTSALAASNLANVRMVDSSRTEDPEVRAALLEQARELHLKAFQLGNQARSLLNVGETLQVLADLETDPERWTAGKTSALEVVERAIELGTETGEVLPGWHGTRGSLLLQLGRVQDALPELELLVRGLPDDIQGLVDLASARLATGDARGALDPLRRVLAREPAHVPAWLTAGEAHRALGDVAHARESYERVLTLARERFGPAADQDPLVVAARNGLAALGP